MRTDKPRDGRKLNSNHLSRHIKLADLIESKIYSTIKRCQYLNNIDIIIKIYSKIKYLGSKYVYTFEQCFSYDMLFIDF